MILTDRGPVRARALSRRHKVLTLGGRYLGVTWLERLDLDAEFLDRYPDLKPVFINAGDLGNDLPARPMILSPNQVIWATGPDTTVSVFGAARKLSRQPEVLRKRRISVSYVAFATRRPTPVAAEGVWIMSA